MTPFLAWLELLRGPVRGPAPAASALASEELFHPDEGALGNGWLASSIELKRGLDVSEQPMDTLPGELLDAFFRR